MRPQRQASHDRANARACQAKVYGGGQRVPSLPGCYFLQPEKFDVARRAALSVAGQELHADGIVPAIFRACFAELKVEVLLYHRGRRRIERLRCPQERQGPKAAFAGRHLGSTAVDLCHPRQRTGPGRSTPRTRRVGTAGAPLKKIWADGAYSGKELAKWCEEQGGWELELVERDKGAKGFEVLPKRWIVERTLGWLRRERRLSKDYERKAQTSETLIEVALIRRIPRRLARAA